MNYSIFHQQGLNHNTVELPTINKMDIQGIIVRGRVGILLYFFTFIVCDPTVYIINSSETLCIHDEPCFTFEQFADNVSQHLRNQTILRLKPGYHSFSSRLNVENIDMFSISSETAKGIINCSQFAGPFNFNNVKMVNMTNMKFIGCGGSSEVLNIFQSKVNINGCSFIHSRGIVICSVEHSEVRVVQSLFISSYAGVVTAKYKSNLLVTNSSFELNTKEAVSIIKSSNGTFLNCIFHNSIVKGKVNIMYVSNSTAVLKQCELTNNKAEKGSIVLSESNSKLRIIETYFKHNSLSRARLFFVKKTDLTIDNCTFANNTVTKIGILHILCSKIIIMTELNITENTAEWGVLYVYQSEVITYQNVMITRNYAIRSTLDIHQSKVEFNGHIEFSNNTGAIFIKESKVVFNKTSTFSDNNSQPNKSFELGGAITSRWSLIYFNGTTKFYRNKARKGGGAINAFESRLYAHSNALYTKNLAEKGGAVHLDHSYFICQSNCTFSGNRACTKGGAIHAIDSIISIGNEWYNFQETSTSPRLLSFKDNEAATGGGISLEANAQVRGPLISQYKYFIQFINNTAEKGEAIFVNDYGTCSNARYLKCFLQTPRFTSNSWVLINITESKNAIYGGLLDRCIAENGKITDPYIIKNPTKGIDYIRKVTKDNAIDRMITSDPVRLCYCQNGEINCTYKHPPVETKKGKAFYVPITAIDQAHHQVNATVQIDYHHSTSGHFGDGQHIQSISNECSNLTLNVYSSYNDLVKLILYATGPCNSTGISQTSLQVILLPCICPIGFQEVIGQSSCQCDCDKHIKDYVTKCNEATASLIRHGNFWINYDNTTNGNPYIIYPNCPYDYCLPSTENVSINLNNPDGSDAQCAFNRIGFLCSTCRPPLSLSIGSSRCLPCPENWPKIFIATLLGAGICGIVFVVITLALNVNIAVGTLNGLVFYMNIVTSNSIIYHSATSASNDFFSIFIAWLNLELGIDTCFYKGLDTYSKIWLQFAFPGYLIVVLFAIIAISRWSSRFAKLIGKRNPVATLATLILISYMKFLRIVVDIFSFVILHYPDGSHKLHWLPDANIEYFKGRHIPLFLIATFIVIIGLSYTIFLFSWQWLLQASNYRLLRWIRNTRFNLFMEANVAAYRPKHRYWTGLLLFVRVVLYLEVAYNSKDSRASLLATALTAASLLLLMVVLGGNVYRQKLVGCLSSFCYFNLLMLSVAQLYWQNNKKGQIISAQISVSAAFALMLGVLVYHTVKTLLEISCLNRLKTSIVRGTQNLHKVRLFSAQETQLMMNTMPTHNIIPTSTEVGLSDSIEASTLECGEERDISGKDLQLSITKWEEADSLREPLLQEEQ